MQKYRAYVHYHFKKGMEESGIKFLETELIKHAAEMGCHNIELWLDEKDHTRLVGTGDWNSLDEARKFQSTWDKKEKELSKFLTNKPEREFYKLRNSYSEKAKKAA